MSFENFILSIYFVSMGIAVITSLILLRSLQRYRSKLPEGWSNTLPLKKLHLGICFLSIFLFMEITGEGIGTYLARHNIYNNFAYSIYCTASTPILFGFLFINTQTLWKKVAYVILYIILVGHLILEGSYHPNSIHVVLSELIFTSVYFLAALLQLTDLLVTPKRDYFKFLLKINLTFLIWSLLGAIISSFLTNFNSQYEPDYDFFFFSNIFIVLTLHISLIFTFITEILKLRRG